MATRHVTTTSEKGASHDSLMPLLQAMYREFAEAAKKKPDGILNTRKVEIVNRLLKDVMKIVEDEPTSAYLDLLDEDEMPQNSDVILILGQFVAAMEAFKEKYHAYISRVGEEAWFTPENLG
jgi:hypothetical protein